MTDVVVARIWRLLRAIWACTVFVGIAVFLLPEQPKIPLVPRHGWTATGAFVQNVRPQPGEISRSILENSETVFWRSWNQESGPGMLTSASFAAPRVLAVPFAGYPAEPGIEFYLECLETGKRLAIATGNAHETWVERTMWLSSSWCPSHVRIVARTDSRRAYIAVGTPVVSSRLAWLKESVFALTAMHALASAILVAPGLTLLWLVGVTRPRTAMLAAIPLTLFLGYASFFAIFYTDRAAKFATILLALVSVGSLFFKGPRLLRKYRDEAVRGPFALMFVVSLLYVFLVYSADSGIGSWAATYRFAPAIWSSDAQLPQMVADGTYRQMPVKNLIGGGWHVSDRPPLLAGLLLVGRPLVEPLFATGDNSRLAFLFYQVLGLIACTLWIVPAWMLLSQVLSSPRDVALGVVLLAATGFVTFNSVYVWPKMLGGALALAAYVTLTNATAPAAARTYYMFSGLLAGLAMLAHAGVAFGLVPIFVAGLWRPTRRRITGMVLAGVMAVALLIPWTTWQRVEDPPGNALIKFALAGTFGMDEEYKGVWETVRDAHAGLTMTTWLRMRRNSLLTLLGAYHPPIMDFYWQQPMDAAGRLRAAEFLYLFPALAVANLGWLAVILSFSKRSPETPEAYSPIRSWLILGGCGISIATFVTFSVNVNHVQSYQSVLFLLFGLYAALLRAPAWLRLTAPPATFAYFLFVWVWSPLTLSTVRVDVAAAGILGTAALALWVARQAREPSPTPAPLTRSVAENTQPIRSGAFLP